MIGQTISHYKILEKIGEGGMSVVYKAEDTTLKRFVALKFPSAQILADEGEKARFIQEARAAALDHPNICTLYEIGEAEGKTFITMAHIEGQSLYEKIKSGPLGTDKFISKLEVKLGRRLRPLPAGRPKKKKTTKVTKKDMKESGIAR